ncbi:SLC13 family permease [Gammaproteobacteria bacterium]|nr:SLC13 family permease [Gammaproteobacteria bacterium]
MPDAPSIHAIATLILTALALLLFTRDRIPLETSSLLVLVLLTVGFELFPYTIEPGSQLHAVDFFSGFGHEALIAVCGLMIVGQGLVRTGALEPFGRLLSRLWSVSPQLSLLLTLLLGGLLSAFVNNVPIVVLLLPILVGVSLRAQIPSSSILMPMGMATLVGGMSTTIGTSTNLLVVSVAASLGLERMSMFSFFLPATIAGGVGILYLWLIAPRILPDRQAAMTDTSPRIFTAQLHIPEGSYCDGRVLNEIMEKAGDEFRIQRIRRNNNYTVPLPDVEIRANDSLSVRDTPQKLKEFEQILEARLYSGDAEVDDEHPLQADDQQIAEIVIVQGSQLINSTLADAHFADRYQLVTLAIHRAGRVVESFHAGVRRVRLRIGDILLVQGARENIAEIKRTGDLLVLDATMDLPHSSKATTSLIIMASTILVAAIGLIPIAISAVLGSLLMLLTGCLGWRDVQRALSVQVILIVVVSLALGAALTETGSTNYLAQVFLHLTSGAQPAVILSGLMLLMAVLTNIVSNNAAAVIGTPIAINIATELALPPEAFVLAVLFGANMSYATPMAYKTNLLVMNAGGYVFSDFLRVGVPLTLIMWLVLSWVLPVMYGF